ncbi:alpha/beta-hydrolase [Basidiobolus meristosporus CBS 931.73]|uniref:Dipeptidyl-peptidase V n=1 Tax=Basidiobolus meristosporus CBS 931.73 TaxID=1314790 RepID=A0A1Y1YPN4_9FUNG|nr:alpha/beta-hydrolase [Basidiobolus meristosporus CBS 931.73]|eukprot:ORX99793.1 alpha/beta-hydrolase [Basidiobolus meristosporus CBS 931.73]
MARPYDIAASPNGRYVDTNKRTSSTSLLDIKTGMARSITDIVGNDFGNPVWLNDASLGFISYKSGKPNLWAVDPNDANSTPVQRTNFTYDEVNNGIFHPDSNQLLFTTGVPVKDLNKGFDTGLAYDKLFTRILGYLHLTCGHHRCQPGYNAIDLMKETPGLDTPVKPFGDANDFIISPDGAEVAFLSRPNNNQVAWHTTVDIFVVPTSGQAVPRALTKGDKGAITFPRYSPDGRYLAWLQMLNPINEADRAIVTLYDRETEKISYVTEKWDSSASQLTFSPDSKTVFVTAADKSQTKVYSIDLATRALKELTKQHTSSVVAVIGNDTLLLNQHSMTHPSELFTIKTDGSELKQITHINDKAMAGVHTSEPEYFWFKGSREEMVQGFILKPRDFDASKKYPLAFWIHGGPEMSFGDAWSNRWNYQIPPSAGYVLININFHGSDGYGQKFTESVLGNWGSLPYEDLMRGLDFALEKYPFIDRNRSCAWGASYGGYMINWINGQTNRFSCLISHGGIFDPTSNYYTIDQLYFMESEFGGLPWDKAKTYEKFSPARYVKNWKTPTLVIHNGHDYRIVDGQGLSVFTALQRQGIPSRLLYFPDETHWVLKPANSLRWHKEILEWTGKYTNTTLPYKF